MGSRGAGTLPCRAGGGWGSGGRHALSALPPHAERWDRWGRDGNAVSRGERSLPNGADPPVPMLPAASMGWNGKHHCERVATGERSVSFAKICVRTSGEAVVPHTSCGLRYGNSSPYPEGYGRVVPIAPICGLCGLGFTKPFFCQPRRQSGHRLGRPRLNYDQ